MSVLEFLGEILPWPASKRPEDVQVCKSRLILQADALRAAICIDPWERMLAHACDRGAAEWEHWLLTNEREPPEERELTAHSALTLAQRSGDWGLVGKILGTWKAIGRGHKRFYRDAMKAYERHWPASEREVGELARLAIALNERPDPDDARKLLSLTEFYAERGGAGLLLHARADAHQVLGEQERSQRAELAACIANPHEWRLAWTWFTRNAMAPEPIDLSAEAKRRALAWYDRSVIVHAGALFLANTRQAQDGPPPEALIASTLALPRSLDSVALLVFVFENIAWALASRGEIGRADAILAEAINRVPTHQGLLDLREATARLLSEPQRRDHSRGSTSGSETMAQEAPVPPGARRPISVNLVEINNEFAKQVKRDVPLPSDVQEPLAA
jgi:hypothetical protein